MYLLSFHRLSRYTACLFGRFTWRRRRYRSNVNEIIKKIIRDQDWIIEYCWSFSRTQNKTKITTNMFCFFSLFYFQLAYSLNFQKLIFPDCYINYFPNLLPNRMHFYLLSFSLRTFMVSSELFSSFRIIAWIPLVKRFRVSYSILRKWYCCKRRD